MAYYFAELDSNNVVKRVVVVSNENNTNSDGNEDESVGIAFCRSLYGANTNWKQSSYNSSIRKNPAGIGNLYNAELDEFIAQQPYSSWTLDSNTAQWVSPLGAEPTLTDEQIASNSYYRWDEDAYQADNTTGWVLETPETE
jgi:hypothetical protein